MHKRSRGVKACGCILVGLSPANGIHTQTGPLVKGTRPLAATHAQA